MVKWLYETCSYDARTTNKFTARYEHEKENETEHEECKEEQVEGLKRVLVHVGNNAKFDAQEVEHSTFSRHSSVYFTRDSNSLLGNLGNNLLLLNGSGGLFGDF